MAWQGRYTETITKKMDDLANSQYKPNYDTQIKGTADQISNYGKYNSQYQPQINDVTNKLTNYGNYSSRYQPQIDSLMNQLANWNYDPEQDKSYQAYKTQYTNLGNQAMRDTLGQVSARTGGLASSYAGSAAQQSYNNYMQQLSNIIPQLEERAYNRTNNSLNMYNNADSTDYGRWADAYNRLYNTGNYLRGLDSDQYGRWQDALNNLYQQNSMYLGMDQNEFARYAQQHQDEYSQVKAMQEYNDWEYQQYLQDLAEQQAALAALGGGYGGGGYGGGYNPVDRSLISGKSPEAAKAGGLPAGAKDSLRRAGAGIELVSTRYTDPEKSNRRISGGTR